VSFSANHANGQLKAPNPSPIISKYVVAAIDLGALPAWLRKEWVRGYEKHNEICISWFAASDGHGHDAFQLRDLHLQPGQALELDHP
jgi:hypothetical protein